MVQTDKIMLHKLVNNSQSYTHTGIPMLCKRIVHICNVPVMLLSLDPILNSTSLVAQALNNNSEKYETMDLERNI